VGGIGQRVRGWFHRERKPVVPRTILIVDSNASERTRTVRLVESLKYQALPCTSLAAALKVLDDEDPDFILLGFDLDDVPGLEALTRIRELDPNLGVVMLAADLWDNRVAEAMRKGAIAYLARPFGVDDLREVFGRR
jgi:DNA-binding NtrC family response regulator